MLSKLPNSSRAQIAYVHDIFMAALSFVLSLYLRVGSQVVEYGDLLIQGTLVLVVSSAGVFLFFKLYRGVWRYASVSDLVAITKAVTVTIIITMLVMFAWTRLEGMPRSLPFINWFILMALLGGPRLLYRGFKDNLMGREQDRDGQRRIPVLLVGAGDESELFIRALSQDPNASYRIVGLVAINPGRVGRQIRGFEVLGMMQDLETIIEKLDSKGDRPQRLILTRNDLDGTTARAALELAERLGLNLARIPRLTDFKSGTVDKIEVRPIAIEDLLGRPQATLDREAMGKLIGGKRVLITGSGGSIGSELVRQVSDFEPSELVLVENGEFNLYAIDMELGQRHPDLQKAPVIADVRDRERLSRVFAEFKPEIVFHAAALKHVPLVEHNIMEGAMTNIVGTRNVAELSIEHGVTAMVQISTDKAVNPTNAMGATKRVAERYCQALDIAEGAKQGTHFVTVRFGNVLGSTGSVVPLFRKQLEAGGPITVTHPDMTRYFMTIREAVELVLQASALRRHGHNEDGKIYVLDMGQPVKIVDLAKQMIVLAGLKPDEDIKIEFTGIRPGEKLFEEIFHGKEELVTTESKGILLASPRTVDVKEMAAQLDDLKQACQTGDQDKVNTLIKTMVPEYQNEVN
ncbi:MAG: polysaccharide biosynthesis protein [Rhodospirillales bacterium]|nr:polysaccharide biosynthesis protein [Rhodospirillales bacterium]